MPSTILKNGLLSRVDDRIRKLKKLILYRTNPPRMLSGFLKDANGELIKDSRFSNTVYFYHREKIRIGENVFIWHFTIIDGTGGLEIEEGCQIGAWVGIFTHSSHVAIRLYGRHYREVPENEKTGYIIKPVKIGKYTFIGARGMVLPGVTIGKGCIVATDTVVTKDVPDYSIVEGNPAEVVGDTRRLDARYLRKDELLRRWYEEWSDEKI